MIGSGVGMALICAVLCALLEGLGFGAKKHFAVLCLLVLMITAISPLGKIIESLSSVADTVGITDAFSSALRAIGLGYVFGFTSDTCATLGESGLASAVITLGKIEIFIIALPYFEKTVELALSLLT